MSGRKCFTLGDDIALTKEVLELNPFVDPANWLKIADRLSELLGRRFSLRSVKERLNLILLRFLRDEKKKIKSSGTEEEQTKLQDLLQRVADLARECGYSPPRSTMRLLADGGKGPKAAHEHRSNVAWSTLITGRKTPWPLSLSRQRVAVLLLAESLLQSIYRQDEAENLGTAFNDAEYDMDLPDFGK
ncbi:hypothetical protein MTO96_046169 [Rhipicephalus appendiculatus]